MRSDARLSVRKQQRCVKAFRLSGDNERTKRTYGRLHLAQFDVLPFPRAPAVPEGGQ